MEKNELFPELIPIGYVQKSIGFDGQLQIQIDSPVIEQAESPGFLWFLQYGKPVPYKLEEYFVESANKLRIRLQDVLNEQDAQVYKGETCFIEEALYDQFFESIESYEYLIGYSVVDEQEGLLGQVEGVLENNNGHDNLVVLQGDCEILIPFVDAIILKIDEKAKTIRSKLPEGLLDLYLK